MAYNSTHTGKEIDNAVDQINTVSEQVDTVLKTVNNHSTILQGQNDKFINLQTSINGIIGNASELSKEIAGLKTDLQTKAVKEDLEKLQKTVSSMATTDNINSINGALIVINDDIKLLKQSQIDITAYNDFKTTTTASMTSLSQAYGNLSNTVTANDTQIKLINQNLIAQEETYKTLNNNITTLGNLITTNDTSYQSKFTTIDAKFTTIDGQFDTINNQFNTITNNFITVEQFNNTINQFTQTLSTYNTTIEELTKRIDALEKSNNSTPTEPGDENIV